MKYEFVNNFGIIILLKVGREVHELYEAGDDLIFQYHPFNFKFFLHEITEKIEIEDIKKQELIKIFNNENESNISFTPYGEETYKKCLEICLRKGIVIKKENSSCKKPMTSYYRRYLIKQHSNEIKRLIEEDEQKNNHLSEVIKVSNSIFIYLISLICLKGNFGNSKYYIRKYGCSCDNEE